MKETISFSEHDSVTKTFEDGAVISARKIIPSQTVPGRVAKHEATHVIPAGDIKEATIIPNGNALGSTTPEIMTAKAAVAPAAHGFDGVGWDLFVAEYILGENVESAKAEARAELSGKEEEVYEVASILEERKTIHQPDVDEARENVRRRKRGIYAIDVKIISPIGETKKYQTESFNEQVLVENEFWELPKAA